MLEEYELLNDELEKRNEELNKEVDKLRNEIEKAIEYIEEWQKFPHTNGSTHKELRNLIQILKGSVKE